jgi:hypothetical protein
LTPIKSWGLCVWPRKPLMMTLTSPIEFDYKEVNDEKLSQPWTS